MLKTAFDINFQYHVLDGIIALIWKSVKASLQLFSVWSVLLNTSPENLVYVSACSLDKSTHRGGSTFLLVWSSNLYIYNCHIEVGFSKYFFWLNTWDFFIQWSGCNFFTKGGNVVNVKPIQYRISQVCLLAMFTTNICFYLHFTYHNILIF